MPKLRISNKMLPVWKAFKDDWHDCQACSIGKWRNRIVHVRGKYPAPLLFIGEAPGRDEDHQGFPFVGKAGKIFDALVAGLSIRWAVINTVACRPSDAEHGPNRPPSDFELQRCQPRTERLIKAINPQMLVKLGKTAEHCSYLSAWFLPVLNARHPAYLARLGGVKSKTFQNQRKMIHAFVKRESEKISRRSKIRLESD